MEEQKTEDYKERLQKVRQRRNGKDPMHWFMIGGCAVIVVLALVIIVKLAQGGTFGGSGNARVASASEAEVQETVIGETLPEDEEQAKEDEEKKNVVESYQNLGIVDVSGYLNMRESASTTSDVIGKLMGGSACEILDDSQDLPAVWRATSVQNLYRPARRQKQRHLSWSRRWRSSRLTS